jgi:hypothetical protein
VCRGNARVKWRLQKVPVAGNSARGLGGDLGASSLKSLRGLRILGFDAGPCIVVLVVIASAMFSKLEHFIISNSVVI